MEDKIKLIDEIVKKHPSYGVSKGWSYYVGGMNDSGDWYFRKMLDISIEELTAFLYDIIKQENTPKIPLTEKEEIDSKIIIKLPNGGYTTKYQQGLWNKFYQDIEYKMFFGE